MSSNPFAKLTKDEISNNLEDIFQVTLNEQSSGRHYYMREVQRMLNTNQLSVDILYEVIFERILDRTMMFSTNLFQYLFECFERTLVYENRNLLDTERIFDAILQNTLVCILQPGLLENVNVSDQFFHYLRANISPNLRRFFTRLCKKFREDPDNVPCLHEFLEKIFDKISDNVIDDRRIYIESYVFEYLSWFTSTEALAESFWNIVTPRGEKINGELFARSLLGNLFNSSVIPKPHMSHQGPIYFDKPFDERSNSANQEGLWLKNNTLIDQLHTLFMSFIRLNENIRNRTLNWISKCLKANESKTKIWNSFLTHSGYATPDTVSDGFMINLLQVLLKMCQPFCNDLNILKVLKVDPSYCALTEAEIKQRNLHYCFANETCLLPFDLDTYGNTSEKPKADSYNFITECFFITQKTMQCSFNVVSTILTNLNEEILKLENLYNESLSQRNVADLLEPLRLQLMTELRKSLYCSSVDKILCRYLTIKSVMTNPTFLNDLSNFIAASAFWLCQVAINHEMFTDSDSKCFAPLLQRTVTLPINHDAPVSLCCVPEIIVENIVGYFVFLRRFHPETFEEVGFSILDPVLVMILIFMGSAKFMRNPHLRARLAECLSMLLPMAKSNEVYYQRNKLFMEHPFRLHIVKNVLEVFVSIEMTGQSVDFEQKFNYRRPMYQIMEFLWAKAIHNKCFIKLAEEAEKSMTDVQPPLFLRFINLLMNDAVFLLDEALSNMSQLRTMEIERDNGQWNSLSYEEMQERHENLRRVGMIAKFDNILGKDTINILVLLTSEIRVVFAHPAMVDRIASMLNFFLLSLVGPNKRNFKVKDGQLYHFHPAEMVLDICKIYIHLKDSDEFCLAISQDGRSYTPQLFSYAEDVLCRISGGGFYVREMEQLNDRVLKLANKKKRQEEILVDVPEEFLDPIMSTLMTDPVMLPSSKKIVDRNTIARHLLSDQTDPFNRSVLTMDLLISQDDLKNRIASWVHEKELAFPDTSSN